ncbi:MAG TPA: sulfotransferase [Nitrososphaera sp.]|jgi:hypothetical protein
MLDNLPKANYVFIIGIQRSGTTILHRLFTNHREVAFLEVVSNRLSKYPWALWLVPLIRARYKYPERMKSGKSRPRAQEGSIWWRFHTPLEYLTEADATEEKKRYYYSMIDAQLKLFGNPSIFVSKNPADCLRLRWLDAIFPGAKYILIWRDPRAVIHSMYQKMHDEMAIGLHNNRNYNSRGNITIYEKFRSPDNPSELQAFINYYSFARSKLLQDLQVVSDRMIQIAYEDFVKNPREELSRLYDFAGLKEYPGLIESIPDKLEPENNEKWKSLPEADRQLLESAVQNLA